MDWTTSNPDNRPALTIETIRRVIAALKAAPPLPTHGGYYWIAPRSWFRLFSKN